MLALVVGVVGAIARIASFRVLVWLKNDSGGRSRMTIKCDREQQIQQSWEANAEAWTRSRKAAVVFGRAATMK
ncbi:MAG: hypothetical protein ABI262_21625 [Microcoleus sp.]|jgi:hypothetical protein